MQKIKHKNINGSHNKNYQRTVSYWLFFLFLSSCFVFLLLGFLKAEGSIVDKAKWLAITLNPLFYAPSLIGIFILTLIGYPFCLPIRKIFKEYTWLLAPLAGFAYWSLWIFPSYVGLPFKLCVTLAALGIIIAYLIALFAGALKIFPPLKGLISIIALLIVVSIFHVYPYSQLGGLTTYSGTGNNDMFYYACRTASITEQPLSSRLPYIDENERGKLYRTSIVASKRKTSIVGTEFFQATIALFPGLNIVSAFPVAIVIAMLLTILGTYLLSRFAFSMSHEVSFLASCFLGITPMAFFIEQNGFLHHLCGVVLLAPIFFMAVIGSSKRWLGFVYAVLFLLALYAHYRILLPLGSMLLIAAPSAICFYLISGRLFKFFSKLWLQKRLVARLLIAFIVVIIVSQLLLGIFLGMKYAFGQILDRIPHGFQNLVGCTLQEVFGIQPRIWLNKGTHSINEHSIFAKGLLIIIILSLFAGIFRLLINKKREVSATALALLSIIGILGFAFYRCNNPYASLKFWSYVWPLLCIFPMAGIMLVVEKWPNRIFAFLSFGVVILFLNVNAGNLFISGDLNVKHAKHYGIYVDIDRKNLKKLFLKTPVDATIFLGQMNGWDKAWATYYGREWNITTDELPAFYYLPEGKRKEKLKLLDDWTYRITTEEMPSQKSIAREGRFYLYER